MTATLERPTTTGIWAIGAPRLLAGLAPAPRLDLQQHQAVHGPLPAVGLDRLLDALDAASLAGRGGAGFPFATKIRALRRGRPVVLVNGSESEPASWKDRTIMRRAPHLVLDGALAVGSAIGARTVIVSVHDPVSAASLKRAVAERDDAAGVRIVAQDGRFVSGEIRAVARSLTGGAALPPGRRVQPTERGVQGAPTLASNVETFAQVAVLLRMGAARYRATGSPAEPGTALLTVGGAVAHPGVVEIPLGTPLSIVLAAAGATDPQAVVMGGYHGAWLAPVGDIQLSRQGLAAAGGTLGAGVLLVVDSSTCALGELVRVTNWLAAQSARQCGPCTFGLPSIAADVASIWHGGRAGVEAALRHARAVERRGACAHPDGTARFVTSGIHLLHDEIDQHLHGGGCGRAIRGQLPVPAEDRS